MRCDDPHMRRPPALLFQYWDTPSAPPDVENLVATWSADPDFANRRFDRASVQALLAEHCDARTVAAFDDCAAPAMQADLFRYAALYLFGGVYVDADIENLGGLAELLRAGRRGRKRGRLLMRRERVANDLMFVRNVRDPLMKFALESAIDNVVGGVSNNVWEVSGPGILTRLWNSDLPGRERLFAGFLMDPVSTFKGAVRFHWTLDYKETDMNWRNVGDRPIFIGGPALQLQSANVPEGARLGRRRRGVQRASGKSGS